MYFKLSSPLKDFLMSNVCFSNSPQKLSQLITDDYRLQFGEININVIKLDTFILYHDLVHDISLLTAFVDIKHRELSVFFNFLWFIKDNSSNLTVLNIYENGNRKDKYIYTKTLNIIYSNAKGMYEDTIFSHEELRKTKSIMDTYMSIISSETLSSNDENLNINTITTSPLNKILFKSHNRIERAFMFLQLGRSQSFLPIKIMYYMSILESLFTTDDIEITKNIKNRTSKYLGGNAKKRNGIAYYIGQAYEVRSRLVHGDSLHHESRQTQQDLIKLSVKIDEIIRELLLKVIVQDSELFLLDNKVFCQWLTRFD